jgi:MoxR-like ATPase
LKVQRALWAFLRFNSNTLSTEKFNVSRFLFAKDPAMNLSRDPWSNPAAAAIPASSAERISESAALMEKLLYEVKRVVVGQDRFLELVHIAILARGHLLIEGVPGLAKTLTVKTLASALQGSFGRVQFTPDLLPSDMTGTRIYNQKTSEFSTVLGPVFNNLVLADEINRAPAKVQSALLEVMQERQVTISGQTFPVPDPFLVMATQNPIETEGTYPLPEAQMDRFMMKVLIGYPTQEEEFIIAQRFTGLPATTVPVLDVKRLATLQSDCRQGHIDARLIQHAVQLVCATREPSRFGIPEISRLLRFGASPRATIGLVEGARALAFLRGRTYVLPQDMTDIAADVLRHRMVLSYDALSEGISADDIVGKILQAIPAPDHPFDSHVRVTTSV